MLDTSAVIAFLEGGHTGVRDIIVAGRARPVVSVITIGELHHGVEAAPDAAHRRRRTRTLNGCELMEVCEVTTQAARIFGHLSADMPRAVGANDRWIAATAIVSGHQLVTFDADFAHRLRNVETPNNWALTQVTLLQS